MAGSTKLLLIVLVSTIVLQEAFAFLRVGRSEKRKSRGSAWELEDERQSEPARSKATILKERVLKHLEWIKKMIDSDDKGDSELYLLVAKRRRRSEAEKLSATLSDLD
eukprot:Seg7191.1 transcript_id=Seg7191.1/GoldUCD/mRNA.D3Y31 product="hypothetical protein" protein_id=Seg7191.1/GoldUCD/D3Y31